MTMTNTKNLSVTVSGLVPYSQYLYEFTGEEANWPTVVYPTTGMISTNNSTSKTIKTKVHFCMSEEICPSGSPGVFNYSIVACRSDPTSLYSNINLILKDYNTNENIFSDVLEVACENCLPKISISMPSFITIANSNTVTISAAISGLFPKRTYNYEFMGSTANWPTTLTYATGQFIAKDPTETVMADLSFCPATGMCETAEKVVLDYILDNNCLIGETLPFSKVKFVLTPIDCGLDSISTDVLAVTCSDCLPKLSIQVPSSTMLSTQNHNIYTMNSIVSGLRKNEEYNYQYEVVSSNWPSVMLPITGSFIAEGKTKNLSSKIMFCSPLSICPSGTEGLLDYTMDAYASKLLKENLLKTSLKLTVIPQTCDIPAKTSSDFSLSCSGCLPCFSYATINFSDTPQLVLATGCCAGVKAITVNVSGAVPGDKYLYSFDSASELLDFTPPTGYVYFGNNGAGVVNTVLSIDIVEFQQVVINCSLQHVDTQIETIDFLAIKCGNSCSL